MKKNFLLILIYLLTYQFAIGQYPKTPHPTTHDSHCSTDKLTKELYDNNPDLEIELQKEVDRIINAGPIDLYRNIDCSEIITVPVVIHYLYDSGNLNNGYDNDNYVINTIMAGLNTHFQRQDTADDNLPPAFQGTAADGTCIEWCLAQYDHPTNANLHGNDIDRDGVKDADGDGRIDEGEFAINRYATTTTNLSSIANAGPGGTQVNTIQNIAPAWPVNEYLNIYIVPDLLNSSGGTTTAGYTYIPNPSNNTGQNCIYIGYDFATAGSTIAHECGHWLGLPHVWGTNGCGSGDFWINSGSYPILDTYPQDVSSINVGGNTCNTSSNAGVPQSCGSVDNIFNVMDYGGCTFYFTQDQKTYMNQCLNQLTFGGRNNFSNDLDLVKCTSPTGCMDPLACNYNAAATIDDGSCEFPDCLGNCLGNSTGNSVPGTFCNDGDPTTVNDIFDANCNCIGTSTPGCTDASACNYDASATSDDGSCIPADCAGVCVGGQTGPTGPGDPCDDGNPATMGDTYDANCNCGGSTVPGCIDPDACNFDATATVDDGSCNPKDCEGNCTGSNTGPTGPGSACDDGDPTTQGDLYDVNCNCIGNPVPGCTDMNACNFNSFATLDDGSCNLPDCAGNCSGSNTGPTGEGDPCDDGDPTTINDVYDFNCNCAGSVILGCTDANACNFNFFATVDDGSCNLRDCDGNCAGSQTGPVGPGAPCDDNDDSTTDDIYDANCNCTGTQYFGCMDGTACNFDVFATVDDGSCVYPDCENNCDNGATGPAIEGADCDDGDPTTTNDVYDANCDCLGVQFPGCTDPGACNFDPQATLNDGTCNLPDCDGICDGLNTGPTGPGMPCDDDDPNTSDTEYDANCNCIEINQSCTTTIEMGYAGWHMISTFCQPAEDSIEVIFAPVVNNIIQVKNLTGQVYVPSFNNFNSGLYTWDMTQGYLVKTNAPTTLTITGGQEVDLAVDYIPLSSGWNMIAYWLQGKAYPIDVFNSIEMDVIQVKDLSGSYIPSFNYFDSIDTIRMNNGYQIKMNAPNNLFFDAADASLRPAPSSIEKVIPQHFKMGILPNPNNATILFMEDNNPMNFGDELGVFTTDGILVASFVYQNEMMGGLVYGDDLTEDGKDGLNDNEKYIFKIWDANLDVERIVEMNFEQGSDRFVKDDLVAVSFKSESTTGINGFGASFNVSLNPNPARDMINFSIDLQNTSNVLIEILDIEGRLIDTVHNKKLNNGNTQINHSVINLTNGMFLYKVTDGNSSSIGKFIISR